MTSHSAEFAVYLSRRLGRAQKEPLHGRTYNPFVAAPIQWPSSEIAQWRVKVLRPRLCRSRAQAHTGDDNIQVPAGAGARRHPPPLAAPRVRMQGAQFPTGCGRWSPFTTHLTTLPRGGARRCPAGKGRWYMVCCRGPWDPLPIFQLHLSLPHCAAPRTRIEGPGRGERAKVSDPVHPRSATCRLDSHSRREASNGPLQI